MFSASFSFYRLFDYLVLCKRNGKTYLLENGYKMLCEFRSQVLATSLEDALLNLFLQPENHEKKQFILFLVSLGFIETRIPGDFNKVYGQNLDVFAELFARLQDCNSGYRNPDQLHIEIAAECNFGCEPCPRKAYGTREKDKHLSLKQLDSLFCEFEALGGRQIVFTGGELFYKPNYKEILRLTQNYGFGVCIHSNGSLISANDIPVLKSLRLVNLQITIFGNQQDYIKKTGNDCYYKVVNILNQLKTNAIPYTVLCPVTSDNLNSYSHLQNLAREHPISFYLMDDCSATQEVESICKHAGDLQSSNSQAYLETSELFHKLALERGRVNTGDASHIMVGNTGNVYSGLHNRHLIGNLHKNNLAEIWMTAALQKQAECALLHKEVDKACTY